MNTYHVKEEQKKSIVKVSIISFVSVVMISISLYFYATEIERKLVTVTWNEIESSTIPKEFHNKKNIAVLRCTFRARIHTETIRKFGGEDKCIKSGCSSFHRGFNR